MAGPRDDNARAGSFLTAPRAIFREGSLSAIEPQALSTGYVAALIRDVAPGAVQRPEVPHRAARRRPGPKPNREAPTARR
jgi:hypothetical protein